MKNYGFTIFIPVADAGEFFQTCINSVLSQDYKNYDVKILYNCSETSTLAWLEQKNNKSIEVFTSQKKLTIEKNWGRALKIQKKEFMVFIGADDVLDHNYLSVINTQINKDSNATIYFAHFRYIDFSGKLVRNCNLINAKETAAEYLSSLFSYKRDTYGTGYVYRSKDYEEVGGIPLWNKLMYADDALWITMMSRGWNSTAKETCFSVRIGAQSFGAKIDWRSWISGIKKYSSFLRKIAKKNLSLQAAYEKFSQDYFYGWPNYYLTVVLSKDSDNKELTLRNIIFVLNAVRKYSPKKLKTSIYKIPWKKYLKKQFLNI